jgi:AcrR family transcriptional regulator
MRTVDAVSSCTLPMVPKLWTDTIEAHRRSVREAIVHTTARLLAEHGLRSVTMSQIAEEAGIGRATLYKYFRDVDSILVAWHEQQVGAHVAQLAALRDRDEGARDRLEAVLGAYALIQHERSRHEHDHAEFAALVHRDEHVTRAQQALTELVRDLLSECAQGGDVRSDISPDELAGYCLHALEGARELRSKAAVSRLVTLTLAGLRPVE